MIEMGLGTKLQAPLMLRMWMRMRMQNDDDNSEEQKELTQSTEYPDRTRTEPIHAWLPI
jgi:hypothetical protein